MPDTVLSALDVLTNLMTLCNKIGFTGGSDGKESACKAGDLGLICGLGRSPEKEMANSTILAWRNPWTEEPGRPQAMGSQSRTRLRD